MKKFMSIILCIVISCSISGCFFTKESSGTASLDTPSRIVEEKVESKLLDKEININIYLPNGYTEKKKYPVLYFLHGVGSTGEDETFSLLGIDKEAEKLILEEKIKPMIIASVQIYWSYGVNSSENPDVEYIGTSGINVGMYEDYVTKEVVPFVDSNYSTISSREGRYIGGISMAGFASIHIAFRNADMFGKVGGHSPALEATIIPFTILYPDEATWKERDPVAMAISRDLSGLEIFLDCGDTDPYCQKGTKDLHDVLVENGIEHEYYIGSGEHNNDYWKSNLEKYLTFYDAV